MRKVTVKEWEKVAEISLGKDWKYKISSAENNKILESNWVYLSPISGKEAPVTKNLFFDPILDRIVLPNSFEELKKRIKELEHPEVFGSTCKDKKEFIILYLEECLEVGRLPGIDGPFDWRPIKIDPRFEDLFERLHQINREKSICLSGGIGNAMQRISRIAEIIKTTLGEATGEEWAGWKLPTLDEWEKAWVILMLQELKKMEII